MMQITLFENFSAWFILVLFDFERDNFTEKPFAGRIFGLSFSM